MIVFSIDTMPMSKEILKSNDYSSKVIFSAVTDTLFKYDTKTSMIVKNACSSYKYSKNKNILRITIRNDLFYSDGSHATAKDYCQALSLILSSKNHIGYILRRFFKSVKLINKYTFELENLNKNTKSFEILSIYSTGCLNEKKCIGPYYIKKMNDSTVILKRNAFFRKKVNTIGADMIKFILTDGVNDYKLYNENKVQITNNTMTKVSMIKKIDYISEKNYIYLNITFSNKLMSNKYKKIRNYISYNVDKNKINEILCRRFKVNDSFIVNDLKRTKNKCKKRNIKIKKLTLSYNDFYPNKIIANEIKKQLEKKGLSVLLVENKFNINNECDLNLTLNHLEYISESSLINGSYSYILLNKNLIYKTLLKAYNLTHSKKILSILNKKLIKLNYKIPLLEMNGYYLKKEDYKLFNYIELNYGDL